MPFHIDSRNTVNSQSNTLDPSTNLYTNISTHPLENFDSQGTNLIHSSIEQSRFRLWYNQTSALCQKEFCILFRHFHYLVLRAIIIPIAFIIYMGYSKHVYYPIQHYGIASPNQPIASLYTAVGESLLVPYYAVDSARVSVDLMNSIMSKAFIKINPSQILHLNNSDEIVHVCAQSLRGTSRCYGGVQWNDLNPATNLYNYTIRGNWGLRNIDVRSDQSDTDKYVLPLQLAIDNAIRNTSVSINSIPYTAISNEENILKQNRVFMNSIKNWIVPSLYIALIGVVYHLSGVVAQEYELGLTNLLYSMQTTRAARISGYLTSFSAVYFPSWIVVGVVFGTVYFKHTNAIIPIIMVILNGFASVSWSLLLGTLFPSAQLAGISAAATSVLLAIMTSVQVQTGGGPINPAAIYFCSLLFTPMSFCMFIQLLCESEYDYQSLNLIQHVNGGKTYPIIPFLAPIFQFFFYLLLTVLIERLRYGHKTHHSTSELTSSAIQINDLSKSYRSFRAFFKRNKTENVVHAVSNLSLSIEPNQIFSLLGANGSGKTTTLDMIAGIQSPSSGSIVFGHGSMIGICPQKNVLWPNLTVSQHIQIWSRIKGVPPSSLQQTTDYFIDKCGLSAKAKTLSKNLSGGQKRKLQIAIMFTGGSNVCCIDEVSSGLDPVSRRIIWDILLAFKTTRTIVLTTHFLDEADLLSDNIAILSQGTIQAQGSPFDLKQEFGKGYRVFSNRSDFGHEHTSVFQSPKNILTYIKSLESNKVPFRIVGPELEDVFLKVASKSREGDSLGSQMSDQLSINSDDTEFAENFNMNLADNESFDLTSQEVSTLHQILALLQKRFIILRRTPFAELAMFCLPIIVVAACYRFLTSTRQTLKCNIADQFKEQVYSFPSIDNRVLMPIADKELFSNSINGYNTFLRGTASWKSNSFALPHIASIINQTLFPGFRFVSDTSAMYRFLEGTSDYASPGGISLIPGNYSIGYQADDNGGIQFATILLNLFTNLLSNGSPRIITNFSPFQVPWVQSSGSSLQFVAYVGLGLAVAPAFAALYPTYERLSRVRAMQYSNGTRVIPLWLSHLLFNLPFLIFMSVIIVGIINSGISGMYGPGYLFITLLLYFIASVLLSFIISLFVNSQLAAFAVVAAYQAAMVLIYLIGFLALQAFGNPINTVKNTRIIYFTIALISPSHSLMRSLFVTVNMFGILCGFGDQISYMGDIRAYGGPILYLILQSLVLFGFLVCWDSGKFHNTFYKLRFLFKKNGTPGKHENHNDDTIIPDVLDEEKKFFGNRHVYSNGLIVHDVSKVYGNKRVVNKATFSVKPGDCFALLGPNGAGKTTTFNMIRGETSASSGDIYVAGISINEDLSLARNHLGVCPQFDAMDKLTVMEVLHLYSKLRGVQGGRSKIQNHVDSLIAAVDLTKYRSRVAHKLSGGNKRKLSLAVALVGNPSVLLLDEPSSGMDAFAKRIMWRALASAKKHRAVVLTTHSMEEADALANRAGILAKKMLAIGTTEELRNKYCGNKFHVHLVCSSAPETSEPEMQRVVEALKNLLGHGVMIEDRMYQGQIKISVPINNNGNDIDTISNDNSYATSASKKNTLVIPKNIANDGFQSGSGVIVDDFIYDEHDKNKSLKQKTDLQNSPQSIACVSQIFYLLEQNKQALGLRSYSVSPTRLEDVFLKIVGEYVEAG